MSSFEYDEAAEVHQNSFEEDAPPPQYESQPSYDQYEVDENHYEQPADGYVQASAPNGDVLDGEYDDGSKLPPPEAMGPEESTILREWKRKKAIELEEKARVSREKHEQIIAQAKEEQEAFYKKRAAQVEQAKINNREKEEAYVASLENMNPKEGGNYWEAVVNHINFEATTVKKDAKSKAKADGPVRTSTLLATQKPGKQTDLARMRQILVKLKKTPPAKANAPAAASASAKQAA